MENDFEKFARAVQNANSRAPVTPPRTFNNITILGGGVEARVMAALFLAENARVTLFSAYGAELRELADRGGVTLRGDGPVGTFQVNQQSVPSIVTTAELDAAVSDAELIVLTGPVHKQRTYAMVLADHLHDGQTLLITPSRTFAAMETRWLLHTGGCQADLTIVELSHLPYWISSDAGQYHLSVADGVTAGVLPADHGTLSALQHLLPSLEGTQNVLASSLLDSSGVIESVALTTGESLISGGDQIIPEGAVPLPENYTFRSLLTSDTANNLVVRLLGERRRVAARLGVRNLPDDADWEVRSAGSTRGEGARRVPETDEARAMLRCAVTGSLVPLQSVARMLGIKTPYTDAMINLSSASLGHNLTSAGRQLANMGIESGHADDVRKQLEAVAGGSVNG